MPCPSIGKLSSLCIGEIPAEHEGNSEFGRSQPVVQEGDDL
jgi:hypothetical protein